VSARDRPGSIHPCDGESENTAGRSVSRARSRNDARTSEGFESVSRFSALLPVKTPANGTCTP
jgi:hypothetical protein